MSRFLAGGWDSPIAPAGKTLYIYIYVYIYIYIYIYIYNFHIYILHITYTYIKELYQQVFIYNEEAPCTSHTSCAKVAILHLQDLTLCVSQIYIVYTFTCLFGVCNTTNLSSHEHV